MWERFTENSRHILFYAQEEAAKAKTTAIAPEHLLLGILSDDNVFAFRALNSLVADLDVVRAELRELAAASAGEPSRSMHLSDGAQRAIDKGLEEARDQNFLKLGPEHILLGILGEVTAPAAICLVRYGVDAERVRAAITRLRPTQFEPRMLARKVTGSGGVARPARQVPRFTDRGRQILVFAREEARRFQTGTVGTEHLLLALLRNPDAVAVRLLDRLEVSLVGVQAEIQRLILQAALLPGTEPAAPGRARIDWLGANLDALQTGIQRQIAQAKGGLTGELELSQASKNAIDLACEEAENLGHNFVGTEHLMLGLVREGAGPAARALNANGISLERSREAVLAMHVEARARLLTPEEFPVSAHGEEGRVAVATRTAPGDLGTATSETGRAVIELAHDLTTYARLQNAISTKDAYGYRELLIEERSVVLIPGGTDLKLLIPPPGSQRDNLAACLVRVLAGEFEGRSGWIDQAAFVRTGTDNADFPPIYPAEIQNAISE